MISSENRVKYDTEKLISNVIDTIAIFDTLEPSVTAKSIRVCQGMEGNTWSWGYFDISKHSIAYPTLTRYARRTAYDCVLDVRSFRRTVNTINNTRVLVTVRLIHRPRQTPDVNVKQTEQQKQKGTRTQLRCESLNSAHYTTRSQHHDTTVFTRVHTAKTAHLPIDGRLDRDSLYFFDVRPGPEGAKKRK